MVKTLYSILHRSLDLTEFLIDDNMVFDIDNLKGKLETLIWDSKLIKCRIIRKIGLLDNDNRREILMRKYIKFESTARISREMFMTRQGVYYHLDIGEKEIERFI